MALRAVGGLVPSSRAICRLRSVTESIISAPIARCIRTPACSINRRSQSHLVQAADRSARQRSSARARFQGRVTADTSRTGSSRRSATLCNGSKVWRRSLSSAFMLCLASVTRGRIRGHPIAGESWEDFVLDMLIGQRRPGPTLPSTGPPMPKCPDDRGQAKPSA